jgi:hypothetical protein
MLVLPAPTVMTPLLAVADVPPTDVTVQVVMRKIPTAFICAAVRIAPAVKSGGVGMF